MFGRIIQGAVRTGGAGTTATLTHNMANATHCVFGSQDITNYGGGAGTVRTFPLFWTTTKNANTTVITDDTAAGACNMTFLCTSGHSLIDIGPIVTGVASQTRTVANVSPFVTTIKPAARSLHASVTFTIANGAAASAAVTITHLLQTANVIAIVFPTTSPGVTTAGGVRPAFVVQNLGAATATTCQLQAQTQDAAVSTAGVDTVITYDVMVLARPTTNAPWSRHLRPHLTAGGVAGDDYGAGDRQLATNRDLSVAAYPSYGAMYTNIDDLAVGPGAAYTHNMGSAALVCVLFEQTIAVAAAYNVLYVINSATSATTATLARGNELAGVTLNARAVFFRPYSWVSLPT
jgi:hypothetical protein